MKQTRAQRDAAFRRAFLDHLTPLSGRLTTALRRLVRHDYPPAFWQLDFEIHDLWLDRGWPVVTYLYRKDFDQVIETDRAASGFPLRWINPLIKVTRLCPDSFLRRFGITDDDYWYVPVAELVLIKWFHRCWIAAGGRQFPYRAIIAPHDTTRRFNLRSGRWTRTG